MVINWRLRGRYNRMQISEVYEQLKSQEGCLTGMEQQVQDLLDTNTKNLQDGDCLKLTTNRLTYFDNQHRAFNVLMEAVGDMKIMNSYALLEIESQLRGDKQKI